MAALIGILGIIALVAIIVLYGAFSWGLVLYKCWYWFILPVFTTLPHITYTQAVGLMLVIGLFDRATSTSNDKKEGDKPKANWGTFFLRPFITLLVAYFIHLVIG